jgi:beta-mannosidase
MERLVRELDGRIFRSTECAQGSGQHALYTYVYHPEPLPYLTWLGAGKQNLYQRYDTSSEMRLSEFGCNSPANLEVWHREIPPESQWPLTNYLDSVLVRKNVFYGAALPQNWLHKEINERVFGPAEDLEQIVRGGQFLAAEGVRYAMDALRRKGTALGGGFMSWDYNEPWPNGAGSYMIDYDGRPLMNYDFVKQALAPVVLSLKYDSPRA